jgi:hypothetical protein
VGSSRQPRLALERRPDLGPRKREAGHRPADHLAAAVARRRTSRAARPALDVVADVRPRRDRPVAAHAARVRRHPVRVGPRRDPRLDRTRPAYVAQQRGEDGCVQRHAGRQGVRVARPAAEGDLGCVLPISTPPSRSGQRSRVGPPAGVVAAGPALGDGVRRRTGSPAGTSAATGRGSRAWTPRRRRTEAGRDLRVAELLDVVPDQASGSRPAAGPAHGRAAPRPPRAPARSRGRGPHRCRGRRSAREPSRASRSQRRQTLRAMAFSQASAPTDR